MEEKKIIKLKKEEFRVREYIKTSFGKGKISKVTLEYTPVGEKIIISTAKVGWVVGRGGSRIKELTDTVKSKFNLENPHIEIEEIKIPELDSQLMADEIALGLERFGPLRFKVIAYRTLQKIIKAGALGAEIRINGKVPGARAKPWRFAQGYLKKTGDSSKVIDRAKTRAETKPGTIGVKVGIFSPGKKIKGKLKISEEIIEEIKDKINQKKVIREKQNE